VANRHKWIFTQNAANPECPPPHLDHDASLAPRGVRVKNHHNQPLLPSYSCQSRSIASPIPSPNTHFSRLLLNEHHQYVPPPLPTHNTHVGGDVSHFNTTQKSCDARRSSFEVTDKATLRSYHQGQSGRHCQEEQGPSVFGWGRQSRFQVWCVRDEAGREHITHTPSRAGGEGEGDARRSDDPRKRGSTPLISWSGWFVPLLIPSSRPL
jgi:hypothetical protein